MHRFISYIGLDAVHRLVYIESVLNINCAANGVKYSRTPKNDLIVCKFKDVCRICQVRVCRIVELIVLLNYAYVFRVTRPGQYEESVLMP